MTTTIAQAVVLGIALSSLASGSNDAPTALAVTLEVAGLVAVAAVAVAGVFARAAVALLTWRSDVTPEGEESRS